MSFLSSILPAQLPQATLGLASIQLKTTFMVFGGETFDGHSSNQVLKYDTDTGNWVDIHPQPWDGRAFANAAVFPIDTGLFDDCYEMPWWA